MSRSKTARGLRLAISPVALTLAILMLPATTAAAGGYNSVTINAECDGVAGDGWHAAIIKLKVKIVARGTTPADYLQIRSLGQRQRNRRELARCRAVDPRREFQLYS